MHLLQLRHHLRLNKGQLITQTRDLSPNVYRTAQFILRQRQNTLDSLQVLPLRLTFVQRLLVLVQLHIGEWLLRFADDELILLDLPVQVLLQVLINQGARVLIQPIILVHFAFELLLVIFYQLFHFVLFLAYVRVHLLHISEIQALLHSLTVSTWSQHHFFRPLALGFVVILLLLIVDYFFILLF